MAGFSRNQAHPDQITIKDTIIEHTKVKKMDDPLQNDFSKQRITEIRRISLLH